jgi:hypothetical protein
LRLTFAVPSPGLERITPFGLGTQKLCVADPLSGPE